MMRHPNCWLWSYGSVDSKVEKRVTPLFGDHSKLLKAYPTFSFSVSVLTFPAIRNPKEKPHDSILLNSLQNCFLSSYFFNQVSISISCFPFSVFYVLSFGCFRICSIIRKMKSMKGMFLKKLKFINPANTISTLKQGLVLQLNPQHPFSNENCHGISVYKDQDCKSNIINLPEPVVVEFKDDQKDEERELEFDVGAQGSIREDNSQLPIVVKHEGIPDEEREEIEVEDHPSLTDFEEKCPPGGEDSVIFYTTSLRGIRKTFEDCSSVRFLLDSFKIEVHERDVAMDMEYREELWRILGGCRVIPPKLFIKGRYIGGADEVVGLHEQGKLKKLFEGIPSILPNCPCAGCRNMRFLVCSTCNGSRKVHCAEKEGDEHFTKCPDCNENGLVKCPVCS